MAIRTWTRMLLAALGVAAFAGAAQLGFAYGLGVVRFGRAFDQSADGLWAAQVAWVAWFTTVAAVAGALAGGFLANRHGAALTGLGSRLAVAGVSAVGALTVAPLTMLPARAAHLASIDPVLTAGLAAVLGGLIGAAAALATVSHRPFRVNVVLVVSGVWLLTLLSVAPSLRSTAPLPDVRLGVVDAATLSDATANRLAVLTMPALALLAGLATGLLSRSRTYSTVVAAGCGAVGPALVALAYLAAGPGGADTYQTAPYWGALIGTGAGALGSVLATVVRLPGAEPDYDASTGRAEDDGPTERPEPAAPAALPRDGDASAVAGRAGRLRPEPAGAGSGPPEPADSPVEQAGPQALEPADSAVNEAAPPDQATRPDHETRPDQETQPDHEIQPDQATRPDQAARPLEQVDGPVEQTARRAAEPADSRSGVARLDPTGGPAEVTGDPPVEREAERVAEPAAVTPEVPAEPTPDPRPRAAHRRDSRNRSASGDRTRSTADAVAPADASGSSAPATPAPAAPAPAAREEPRGGLFRRSRRPVTPPEPDSTDALPERQPTARERVRSERRAPARDEEYVDWVSRLGSDEPSEVELGKHRRRLRSTDQKPD